MPDSTGLVLKNSANRTEGKHVHSYSSFDKSLSYRFYNTLRFGDYVPSFVMEGVENDSISLNSVDRIDSLSLKAPFKGSVRKIKESFMVPNMAILPLNWDKIYVQPSNGSDVPVDSNCVLVDFPTNCSEFWKRLFAQVTSAVANLDNTAATLKPFITACMRMLVIGEYIYSTGSLLHVCGYKASAQFDYDLHSDDRSYDHYFDQFCLALFSCIKSFDVTYPVGSGTVSRTYRGLSGDAVNDPYKGDFRSFLELLRENPLAYISDITPGGSHNFSSILALYQKLTNTAEQYPVLVSSRLFFYLPSAVGSFDTTTDVTALNPNTLNLSRILAYQLVCAHYMTNSSIDFVYSADLYRQYIWSIHQLVHNSGGVGRQEFFNWNGIECPYDYLSGRLIYSTTFLKAGASGRYNFSYAELSSSDFTNNYSLYRFAAFAAIFGFRKSLRYGDYFVGSRPRPLAPINTDVAVNSNLVSVIDITRNIQAQRFANAVMRSRSKVEEYVKSLFGRSPAPDFHNPFYLARQEEIIFGDEVQNTGAQQIIAQNSRTANFASNVGQHTFTFHNDDMHPCIYLQIISFDIRRAYTRSVDRQFLHIDRYDMFNPDFQFIGDQSIYGIELGYPYGTTFPDVFAYTSRDMEYKQRFDVVSSGFVNNLPGWCLTDVDRSRLNPGHLDPDFIRSYNTEFDQFFLSLSGYSLGSYFHFICITDNNVSAKRAMVVDPQILA